MWGLMLYDVCVCVRVWICCVCVCVCPALCISQMICALTQTLTCEACHLSFTAAEVTQGRPGTLLLSHFSWGQTLTYLVNLFFVRTNTHTHKRFLLLFILSRRRSSVTSSRSRCRNTWSRRADSGICIVPMLIMASLLIYKHRPGCGCVTATRTREKKHTTTRVTTQKEAAKSRLTRAVAEIKYLHNIHNIQCNRPIFFRMSVCIKWRAAKCTIRLHSWGVNVLLFFSGLSLGFFSSS